MLNVKCRIDWNDIYPPLLYLNVIIMSYTFEMRRENISSIIGTDCTTHARNDTTISRVSIRRKSPRVHAADSKLFDILMIRPGHDIDAWWTSAGCGSDVMWATPINGVDRHTQKPQMRWHGEPKSHVACAVYTGARVTRRRWTRASFTWRVPTV